MSLNFTFISISFCNGKNLVIFFVLGNRKEKTPLFTFKVKITFRFDEFILLCLKPSRIQAGAWKVKLSVSLLITYSFLLASENVDFFGLPRQK